MPHTAARHLPVVALAACLCLVLGACSAGTAGQAHSPVEQDAGSRQAATGDRPAEKGAAAEKPTEVPVATPSAAMPSTAGALSVRGAQLVGEDGDPVQLRGVSTHGLAWFPGYVNRELFGELRSDWGANVVRLALYTAESGGYCTDGDRAKLQGLVEDGVDHATEADLYAIVDWHVLSDADPNEHVDDAKAFFGAMAEKYADHDNVIYEICNEPNGDTSWDDIKRYADEVIPVIREHAPDAVVLVGTPTWSQRVDEAAADPLDFDNVMYTLHFYAATHQQDLRDRLQTAVGAGLPVFVSEFGICDASGSGAVDYASADAWVDLMDSLDVSYVCWNLSNKDESSALFKPGCDKTSGFERDDLSEEGAWLWDVLHGERG